MTLFYFLFHVICDMYIFLHFYCYGMRSAMLQINEYDDDDDDHTMFCITYTLTLMMIYLATESN